MVERLLEPEVFWGLIPIIAIVGVVIHSIVDRLLKHRERIALIEQGIDPDTRKPLCEAGFDRESPPATIKRA